jgi:hypothetical protein
MNALRLAATICLLNLVLVPTDAFGVAITGWLRDTSFGGGAAASVTAANTNSPILGSGASNNADNVAMYAPMPLVSLSDGQETVLTGSAEMIGAASVGDFRWGLFKDDGVAPDTAGWLGYLGSAESIVWSKDPTGTAFASTTFASVAAGRGFTLGQMSEPNGHAFLPGTYAFKMTVQRFGNESLVKVGITSSASGFAIETPFYSESNPARRTFALDRVGFLSGSALDADQIRFSGIDVASGDIEAPTLKVYSSGLVFITNPFNQTFDLTHYEITSAAGGLSTAGWLSLDDQENDDPIGVAWEEAGGSSANVLAEVNLLSSTSLASGGSLRLGQAFATGFPKDVAFQYTVGETVLRGPVKYALTGDYNGNGTVDAGDYVVWRNTAGQNVAFGSGADGDGDGIVGAGDYTAWRSAFGSILAPAAGQGSNVPEPEMICLIGWACAAYFSNRYVHRRVSKQEYEC